MGEGCRLDVEQLLVCSSDLVVLLKDQKDIHTLSLFLDHSADLTSQCHADFDLAKAALQEYEKKRDMCKQKIAEVQSETASDAELDSLEKELGEELKRERLLREELSTAIASDIEKLESLMVCIHERRLALKKREQADKRAEMKLSMYASVTKIIPSLEDKSTISGHIVDKEKKVVEKFEFDTSKMTDFDTCNSIWKMIDS